jgi:hypothetical protein
MVMSSFRFRRVPCVVSVPIRRCGRDVNTAAESGVDGGAGAPYPLRYRTSFDRTEVSHMHAAPLHPRRTLLAAVAATLALALGVLMPAALDDASFSLGTAQRSGPAQAPAPAATTARAEPNWEANPFAYPLLQIPGR